MVPQLQKKHKIRSVTSKLSIKFLSILKIIAVAAVIFSDMHVRFQEDFSFVTVKNSTQCAVPQRDPVLYLNWWEKFASISERKFGAYLIF